MSSQPQKGNTTIKKMKIMSLLLSYKYIIMALLLYKENLFYFTNITTDSALEFFRQEI